MKNWIVWGSLSGFFAVALGAFGAHALEGSLDERMMDAYRTAVLYHLMHSALLVAVGILACFRSPTKALNASAALFLAGVVLFSGSLYLLAVTAWRPLAMATPVGGLAFLGGWLLLARAGLRL